MRGGDLGRPPTCVASCVRRQLGGWLVDGSVRLGSGQLVLGGWRLGGGWVEVGWKMDGVCLSVCNLEEDQSNAVVTTLHPAMRSPQNALHSADSLGAGYSTFLSLHNLKSQFPPFVFSLVISPAFWSPSFSFSLVPSWFRTRAELRHFNVLYPAAGQGLMRTLTTLPSLLAHPEHQYTVEARTIMERKKEKKRRDEGGGGEEGGRKEKGEGRREKE